MFVNRCQRIRSGAYKTPQLLELSGIGKESILKEYGIITRIDLPVGENYQDHLMVSMKFGLTSDAQGELLSVPYLTTAVIIPFKLL
jgi:choline dehydrogenase-like flavoprotein